MPRTPLSKIDGNSIKNKELSEYLRGQIIGKAESRASQRQIAHDLQLPRTTVQYTLQCESTRINGKSSPRIGRPKTYTERDKRHILTIIKRDLFITYQEIREQTGLQLSAPTFRIILRESRYGHWRAKKRPRLLEEHAKKRLEWAKQHRNWTYTEWSKVIWSDESSIKVGKDYHQPGSST